ncbi:MAG TPA: tryptophan synthase subunit alpha [Bacteroidales bacterium]|nr:tryptophan synthase subunit alpha [Bacteroidales bacterium]
MNRIEALFKRKKDGVLSVYMTAGFPERDDTVRIIKALDAEGVDMIELGMPFSDPLADGEVIQHSSHEALENGMNIQLLFEQLKDIRKQTDIPLVLMGYLNPVMAYGFPAFIDAATETGIDGLILPDLPAEIYKTEYQHLVEQKGVSFSMLITPQTNEARIREIANLSKGFLYMVADSATTGTKGDISDTQLAYFERIRKMNLEIPRMIGFGISSHETFKKACNYANGAIIGSAFIRAIQNKKGSLLEPAVNEFVGSVRGIGKARI